VKRTQITEDFSGRKNLDKIKRRFLGIAKQRMTLTQESLTHRQNAFFEILPLLFHLNHPLLPGYINSDVPAGIPDYTPGKLALQQAKKCARSFQFKRQACRTYPIYSLFVMGSAGTIAYSKQSDFDIWLCHDPAIQTDPLDHLAAKSQAIEAWATTLGLEIHFFLINAERFRAGDNLDLSAESSGNTLHHLLLEEFYRTGMWIAGRVPIWWFVPPAHDHEYTRYVDMLLQKRFIDARDVFDVGGLEHVDAKEFFSGALWQLYKGMDSPYKSMLKIMLMEVYAAEYPNPDWLSHRFKQAVYAGDITNIMDIDPYVTMLTKLEQFFSTHNEAERIRLLRESFYFKVNEPLSQRRPVTTQVIVMQTLTQRWQWDEAKLKVLDRRRAWKIGQVKTERKRLSTEFSRCYRELSQFAQTQGCQDLMSSQDLHILGRKLYAVMDRRPSKIETVNLGISDDMAEAKLTIQQQKAPDQIIWSVYTGDWEASALNTSNIRPIHQNRQFLELLVWCQVNGIVDQKTHFQLHVLKDAIGTDEFHLLLKAIHKAFEIKFTKPDILDFAVPARLTQALLFINIGLDPFEDLSRQGAHLISSRTDALCYGGVWVNLAITFDWVVRNNWQEVFVRRFVDIEGLLICLCDYLHYTQYTDQPLPEIQAYSYSSLRGPSIAQRIQQLFTDVQAAFFAWRTTPGWYVLQAERHFYVVYQTDNTFQHQMIPDSESLITFLGDPRSAFIPCMIDPYALQNSALKVIYPANRAHRIQVFFQIDGKYVHVYVLDEKGALFEQTLLYQGEQRLLSQYDSFLSTVDARRHLYVEGQAVLEGEIEYYLIQRDNGDNKLEPRRLHTQPNTRFYDVKVMAETTHGHVDYTIYCNAEEFSSLDHGDQIFQRVAQHILACRATGERYPIYVTDIDVSPDLLGVEHQQMHAVNYLKYKKKIERKLNQTIRNSQIKPPP